MRGQRRLRTRPATTSAAARAAERGAAPGNPSGPPPRLPVGPFALVPGGEPARYWRFLAVALLLMTGLYAAYFYPYDSAHPLAHAIDAYLELQARAAAALIGCVEPGVRASGAQIGGRFPLRVVKTCSSLDTQILYASCVIAFPARLRARAWGLAVGLPALGALNLLRIAGLYFVGAHAPAAFDTVHEEVFPIALIAFTCAAFALWTRWAIRDTAR